MPGYIRNNSQIYFGTFYYICYVNSEYLSLSHRVLVSVGTALQVDRSRILFSLFLIRQYIIRHGHPNTPNQTMIYLKDYFSIQVFFIVLRETLELAIIISVLIAFVDQASTKTTTGDYRSIPQNPQDSNAAFLNNESQRLKLKIWIGGILGLFVCLIVGSIILIIFYAVGNDLWSLTEHYWEGVFSIVASVIISVMGVKILRVTKMQKKWRRKLGAAMEDIRSGPSDSAWKDRNALFILPFVTTLREGLEAIVFVGGIGIDENTSVVSIVNSAVFAMTIGFCIGLIMYRTGHTLSIQLFLITSTCFLYLVAAGLFSKGVWNLELQQFINKCGGTDVSETGDGPGSYDIFRSVWHVNCCNGERAEDGVFWMLFTAVFGWTNSATYGSVLSYNLYWLTVISMFGALTYEEHTGRLPFIPLSLQKSRVKKWQHSGSQARESMESIDSRTNLVRP